MPFFQKAYRTGIYWGRECFVPGFTVNPKLAAPARKLALKNIEDGISDPELRKAVTPDFQIGCKRILISNDYYPALDSGTRRPRHRRDRPDHARRASSPSDGTVREVDAIIVATGFYTTEQPIAQHIKGRDGRTLADAWGEEGMAAYKGTTIAGFPNLFQIVGPNTGLGHSSMVFIIESQIAYILSALQKMGEREIATVEPRPEAQQAWNEDLQQADAAHRVEHRWLRELVPRLPRPQHHAVAAHHLQVPLAAERVRHRAVRRDVASRRHRTEGARRMTTSGNEPSTTRWS